MDEDVREHERKRLGGLPPGIWALGFVSMFMDISSEMIHGLLPVFLTSMLGASTEMVGLIEGVGEATASICKLFSGWLSDTLGKRKVLAVFGYSLAALSKPLFAIAPNAPLVLAARFLTRALFLRANIEEPLRELHELGHAAPSEGEYLNNASETIAGFFGAKRHELRHDRLGETPDLVAPLAVLDRQRILLAHHG